VVFEDPITFEVMQDAVIAPCGHSFSDHSIKQWLSAHSTCPTCKLELTAEILKPNYVLRDAIEQYLKGKESGGNDEDIRDGASPRELKSTKETSSSSISRAITSSPSDVVVKELYPTHVDMAATLLEQAYRSDPFVQYFYSGHTYKPQALAWFYGRMVTYGIQNGRVWAAYSGGVLKGVALWQPPYDVGVTTWSMVRAGMASAPFRMGIKPTFRAITLLNYTEKMRAETINTPHWSIYTIGVLPSDQNHGIGTKMTQQMLAMADSDNLPIYLDTACEQNLRFFQRLGFQVAREVTKPPIGPRFWTMLRPAQK